MTASLGFISPRFTIKHEPYIGIALNDLNNEIPAWDDPEDARVYGWRLNTTEQRTVSQSTYTSRQTTEGILMFPPTLTVNIRDIFTLPEGRFEVVEFKDLSGNPFRWHPGDVAVIRKIKPKGTP